MFVSLNYVSIPHESTEIIFFRANKKILKMQYKYLIVLTTTLFMQSSVLAVSKIGPICVPPRDCPDCPFGVAKSTVKSGCAGCPECCWPLPCAYIECEPGYVSEPTTLSNGCPGCYTCVQCPLVSDCPLIRCAPGYFSQASTQANGCPGCNECVQCEPVSDCPLIRCAPEYESRTSTQANGCPGCNECVLKTIPLEQ
ncbi:uncharacterized protein LOC119080527 [Bradysia coprophila]|uniref:uncharacterized protein LOC119080527 n=1 Tax=Bradysia coprophila TaxID=38358 RepID=UPI00187DC093|nr:uncharacterized protein LOC119080527 [Bradysia coprophila]